MPKRRIIEGDDELANIPLRTLRERLRELIALRNTNAKEVSLASGNSESYVRDILSGRSNNPRMSALQAIADVLQCDLQYLLGQSDTITTEERRRNIAPMPVLYIAETGAFRQMLASTKSTDLKPIHADPHPSYPHARHFAADVRDDAMSGAGITDGMFALCVEMATGKLAVESGKIYIIKRSLDGGKTNEFSIRRAMVYTDRTEYRPESEVSDYPSVTVAAGSQMDDQDAQVEPVGLVYGIQRNFY